MVINEFDRLPDSALLNRDAVVRLTGGQHPDTLDRWSDEGKFPAPISMGRFKLYRVSELRTWLSDPVGFAVTSSPT